MAEQRQDPAFAGTRRACRGRADLICILGRFGRKGLAEAAWCAGYERRAKEEVEAEEMKPLGHDEHAAAIHLQSDLHCFTKAEARFAEFCVQSHRMLSQDEVRTEAPDWWRSTEALSALEEADPAKSPPLRQPLLPWRRQWPFLHGALGAVTPGHTVDISRIVERLAKGRPLDKLIFRSHEGWAGRCQVILDLSEQLRPFWEDLWLLCRCLSKLRGAVGLDILVFEQGPDGGCRDAHHWHKPPRPYSLPPAETPVLVLSDLGLYDATGRERRAWFRFGRRLKSKGLMPVALTPCPPRLWDGEAVAIFRLAAWDRGQRLPRLRGREGKGGLPHQGAVTDPSAGVAQLLTLLAPAIRVEPSLLRAARLLLPVGTADAGTEAAVWFHEDVATSVVAFAWQPEVVEKVRAAFTGLPEALQKKAVDLVRAYHVHLSPYVQLEERLLAGNLAGVDVSEEVQRLGSIARTLDKPDSRLNSALSTWLPRVFERQHREMWEKNEFLGVAWAILNREVWRQGQIELPPGLLLSQVLWALSQPGPDRVYTISRRGRNLVVRDMAAPSFTFGTGLDNSGSPVARVVSAASCLWLSWQGNEGPGYEAKLLSPGSEVEFAIPFLGEISLATEREEITLATLGRPHWAMAIGRDRHGLFVTIPAGIGERRAYWLNPGRYPVRSAAGVEEFLAIPEGFWLAEKEFHALDREGFRKPAWADNYGIDRHGLFADVVFKGVTQRFRWIVPGVFLMGSPPDEPERRKDETQHEVILTKGFWLADTACTQALWQAVMSENPSNFKGEQLPVENVSWKDCQRFIQAINTQAAGLDLRLCTEAEWEYGCRAGTMTPFFFGVSITPEEVNYDGDFPYAGGKKGLDRGKTVEVGSLPCNSWGLHEMHGNVWEWCADWKDEYPTGGVVIDPVGPPEGAGRVLRGGGWISSGRNCRSACRDANLPAARASYYGFRLARGQ